MRARGGKTLAFNDAGTFAAYYRMCREMGEAGFSLGSSERGQPLGVLFGEYTIAKWRNLTAQDRSDLHGLVDGDRREGPLLVTIFDDAPRAAREALSRMFADRLAAAYRDGGSPHDAHD